MKTREIQTYQYNTKGSHMMREFGTQMEKSDLYVDNRNDKILYPKTVYDPEKWMRDRKKNTLYIQCRIRGWFARRLAEKLRQMRDDRDIELLNKQE